MASLNGTAGPVRGFSRRPVVVPDAGLDDDSAWVWFDPLAGECVGAEALAAQTWPRSAARSADSSPAPAPGLRAAAHEHADGPWPRRILIVDDQEEVRAMLGAWFEFCGIPVVTVEGAPQAREALRLHPEVDLALVDIWMPGEDGYALVRSIRDAERQRQGLQVDAAKSSRPDANHLPVFAISADPSEEARRVAQSVGFDGFLGKPLQLNGLVERLRQRLFTQPDADAGEPGPDTAARAEKGDDLQR